MSKCNYKNSEHVIIYLDFLGATDRIMNETRNIYLNQILSIYEDALNLVNIIKGNSLFVKKIEYKIFSDNMVIATNLKNIKFKSGRICCMLLIAAVIQVLALEKGWLIRGSVVVGNCTINDVIVWGKGLVKAYKLEENNAIYPRVIIDDSVISLLHDVNSTIKILGLVLKKDFDNIYYIDYLKSGLEKYDSFKDDILNKILNSTKLMLKNDSCNFNVKQKLNWHINYLNNYCIDIGFVDGIIDSNDDLNVSEYIT